MNSLLFYICFTTMIILSNTACTDQVPILSGPAAQLTTCGDFSSEYPGWKAFDSSVSTMWISKTWVSPAWIAYQFPTAKTVTRYSIYYKNGQILTRAPKVFQLQGSNDGGNTWTTVDSRTNEINWLGSELRTYLVSSPGSYSKYRLYVIDDNDSRSGVVVVSMGDLTFETCNYCATITDQVPILTSTTPELTASGSYSGSYPAWQAFDSSAGTMWLSEVYETPAWIAYAFSIPRWIEQYSITYSNGQITTRAPKVWSLEGWNGVNWVAVDSRSNEINWLGMETRSYTVANPGSYSSYRLNVIDDNDSRDGVVVLSIGTLSLKGCVS